MTAAWTLIAALAVPAVAPATINLEWRPETQIVLAGGIVDIGLYAVSDDPEMDQYILAMDIILNWDSDSLELVGVDNNGPYDWLFSGFPVGDVDGLNETFLDGDALYTALGQLGAGAWATPEGLLVTTFQFSALAETPGTTLTIPEDAGSYTHTAIWGSPGVDVHGTLGSAMVTIVQPCSPTVGDVNGDKVYDMADIAAAVQVLLGIDTDPDHVIAVDANCDEAADGLDLQPLVDLWLLLL